MNPSDAASLGLGLWCCRLAASVVLGAAMTASALEIDGPRSAESLPAAEHRRAPEVFAEIQQNIAADRKRGDWPAFLADAKRQKAFLNGSPISGLEVARAQLELRDEAAALVEIHRFVAMGQLSAALDSPRFQRQGASVEAQLKNNALPLSLAKPAFSLSEAGRLPEDIDYDPSTQRFFVSSVLKHDLVALDRSGRQQRFAEAPEAWPMLALKVDSKRRRLWATEVAMDGFKAVAPGDWGRSVLLEYDLDRGTLLARFEGPPRASLGDMALAPNGDPIVSDGTGGGVYRFAVGRFRRIDQGDFLSPQTVAICDDGRHAFVPDYVRGIAAFDLKNGGTRWLSTKNRYALDGVDGLYCRGDLLLAVQNGTSPQRVVAFTLDSTKGSIVRETLIERATATLGTPTHGVFVGDAFFYIANSGWNALDEHGVETPEGALTPAVIMQAAPAHAGRT